MTRDHTHIYKKFNRDTNSTGDCWPEAVLQLTHVIRSSIYCHYAISVTLLASHNWRILQWHPVGVWELFTTVQAVRGHPSMADMVNTHVMGSVVQNCGLSLRQTVEEHRLATSSHRQDFSP